MRKMHENNELISIFCFNVKHRNVLNIVISHLLQQTLSGVTNDLEVNCPFYNEIYEIYIE